MLFNTFILTAWLVCLSDDALNCFPSFIINFFLCNHAFSIILILKYAVIWNSLEKDTLVSSFFCFGPLSKRLLLIYLFGKFACGGTVVTFPRMRKFAIVFIYLLIFAFPLCSACNSPYVLFFFIVGLSQLFVPGRDIVDFLFGSLAILAFVSPPPACFFATFVVLGVWGSCATD